MSLIHWWPLNGNTNDLGLNPISLTNNGATVNSAGKIGQTYRYNGGVMVADNNDLSSSTTNLTIAGWVYLNSGNYAYVFSCRQGIGGPGLFISLETGCSIFDDGTRWTTNYCIPLNTWVHFAFTRDASGKKLYINGALHSQTSTLGNLGSIHNKMYIGRNYYNDTASTSSDVMINDFRIYNHTLSAKEVKELSKGLILHYNFEDCYNNNLLINSDQYTFTNKLTVSRAWADGWSCWPIYFNSLTTATTYTLSVDFDGLLASTHGAGAPKDPTQRYCTVWLYFRNTAFSDTDYSSYNTSICFTANNYNHKQISATRHQWTFTLGTNITYYPCCAIRTNTYSDGSTTVTVNFWNFKLEKSNTSTPFISNTLSQQQVYDNSGYGYNGTITGDLQVVNNSASGNYALYSPPGANYVERQNIPWTFLNSTQEFTATCWLKIVSYNPTSTFNTIFRLTETNSKDTQLHMCYNASGKINLSQYQDDPIFNSGIELNKWAHVTWVHYKEGTDIKCKYYKDGELVGVGKYTGALNLGSAPRLTLFYDSIRNSYGSDAYIGDLKIYSTALSAEDVKAEYNRKAAIDKDGNLFTGEFVEGATKASILKNNMISSPNFAEIMTLEDGSCWVPISVHYVPDGLNTSKSKTSCYTSERIWNNFGAINTYARPEDEYYEFYVLNQQNIDSTFDWYRFKQTVNPLTATWAEVNPSNVGTTVIRVGSNKSSNNGAGMYWMNSGSAMCFANTGRSNTFGCGCISYWHGADKDIPSYNNQAVKGWQLVYMRITNSKAKILKSGVISVNTLIEK